MKLDGGCLCGKIRYQIDAKLIDAGYCHCSVCRRASGAPVVAWLTIPVAGFTYTRGQPGLFQSSEHSHRELCSCCGTQISFRKSHHPLTVDVTLASLDDTTAVKPEYHIWVKDKVDWLSIDDGLPQFDDAGPDIY